MSASLPTAIAPLRGLKPHDPRSVAGDEVDISPTTNSAAHDHLGVHDGKPWLDSRIAAGRVVDAAADGLVFQRTAQLVGGDAVDRAAPSLRPTAPSDPPRTSARD